MKTRAPNVSTNTTQLWVFGFHDNADNDASNDRDAIATAYLDVVFKNDKADDKILDWSKLKQIADNILKLI